MISTLNSSKPTEISLDQIVLVPHDALEPMPGQPRQTRDAQFENELCQSILDLRALGEGIGGTGITDALSVFIPTGALDERGRLKPDQKLRILSGETRWRVAGRADEERPDLKRPLPVVISDTSADRAFELALFANLHRRDMDPLDEARAFFKIKEKHGFGYNGLAQYLGKTRDYVRDRLKLLGDENVSKILVARPDATRIVRRINQQDDEEFKEKLVELAMNGAPFLDIEDTIAARRSGLTLERYRSQKRIETLEREHKKEAAQAKSYSPVPSLPTHGAANPTETETRPAFTPSPTESKPPTESGPQSELEPVATDAALLRGVAPRTSDQIEREQELTGSRAAHYVGDAFDTLLRELQDTAQALSTQKLTPATKERLRLKAAKMREVLAELETGPLAP